MKQITFKQTLLTQAILLGLTLSLSACNDDDDSSTKAEVAKPAMPAGLGEEFIAAIPDVSYPLPSVDNADNNADGTLKRILGDNAVAYLLQGMNGVWQGVSDEYQQASTGNGPNGDDLSNEPVINATTWQENIAYVVDVTTNRSDDQALLAFLDDRRSKNYSVIDGYGPLTEAYVAASGAYVDLDGITTDDVLNNANFAPDDNDGAVYMGAADQFVNDGSFSESMPLSDVANLVYLFRQASPASTSASKYMYSTPRPWRMDDNGEIDFQGTTAQATSETGDDVYTDANGDSFTYSYSCVDVDGVEELRNYDIYTSSVVVVPGLTCARRAHSNSKDIAAELYTWDSENRRKDGGYPSGHTNAGYLAGLAYAYALPQRFSEMVYRASQLGENRIIAGMHSPVDVIGGRMHAMIVAAYALNNDANNLGETAYETAQDYFGDKAEAAGMSLYDYAHQTVSDEDGYSYIEDGTEYLNVEVFDNNIYDDHDAIKQQFTARLTYGMTQDEDAAGADPIVPEGAEALLKTRLPYLSSAQRRAVLYTTEIDSGYPLLDDSNGWGRINLLAAADGYGKFLGDVNVNMNASAGGFNAQDWWQNDISGEGKLTKSGTGQLTLTGDNSYSGGTVVTEGTLEATSSTAFGSGDLYLSDGIVEVNADGALVLSGNLTIDDGELLLNMDSDDAQISVAATAYIAGGSLRVDFSDMDLANSDSDEFTLLTADVVEGEFDNVSFVANGYAFTLEYTNTAVIAHLSE